MTDNPQASGGQTNPANTGGQAQPTPPPAAQPAGTQAGGGQQPAAQTQPPKPVDPNAPKPTGTLGKRDSHHFVIPAHPNTQFDEEYFLVLLEGSISLTLPEKQRVIEAIPRLSIEQINELIKIFEEEKQKFAELESEFGDDVAQLKKQREAEFQVAEVKQEEMSEAEDEAAEAEALRKKLMGEG